MEFAQLRRRRQVEAFLRESEERLDLATTSAGAGLWAIDQTTRQIWLTERARQLFGPLGGKAPDWENLLSAIHPDDREQIRESVEEARLRAPKNLSKRILSTQNNYQPQFCNAIGNQRTNAIELKD